MEKEDMEIALGIMEQALLDVAKKCESSGRQDIARYARGRHAEAVRVSGIERCE